MSRATELLEAGRMKNPAWKGSVRVAAGKWAALAAKEIVQAYLSDTDGLELSKETEVYLRSMKNQDEFEAFAIAEMGEALATHIKMQTQ